ncbi:MAG: xanthine dehydrogenase family protein [Planctomycetes bacterium]|nr:xanthine dehydrogenase family protein [Planctomycetota bacterium]
MYSVGHSEERKDGVAKVRGTARYVDDMTFPGMLHARTIRSTIACGEVLAVRHALEEQGFTVVTARDIPGENVIALIADDQPCLADGVVRHAEEPLLIVAHPQRAALWQARVDVEYHARAPLLDAERSSTIFKEVQIDKGDPGRGFAAADVVVEGEYRTSWQEQLYIEPNGVIAVPENGGVTIHGSLQCPYYVHAALCRVLGLAGGKVRVVQAVTGGGFGGKEEYPSMIAAHAALAALKSGRPVKLVYDRMEDMAATTKRHPAVVRHRTGVTWDGRITAMDIDVLMDAGAYTTLSPVVISRGALHATGPYRCDHVHVRGRAVMTNTPPNGAFRGFGAPQTEFAAEAHMDRIAERLAIDPLTLRERNAWRPGDTTATGQTLGADCSALDVLCEAALRTDFQGKWRRNRGSGRGIGLSLFFHGAGFTGAGEERLASRAALELTAFGARIHVSSTELGQGAHTVLPQIVAETLRVPYEYIEIAPVDTAGVPDSGPTVASRTSMIVGGILQRCAEEMRDRLGSLSPEEYLELHGPLVITKEYERPPGSVWDEEHYRGDAYGTYTFGCNVVELEVDPVTYEARPRRLTAVLDFGKALNPALAKGQIEGGSVQGLGYALLEEVVHKEGRMANNQLANYAIPTTLDVPPLDVVILETPYRHGPFGAKGLVEAPIDGPAPAVINALRNAGYDLRSLPATPEKIMEARCGST